MKTEQFCLANQTETQTNIEIIKTINCLNKTYKFLFQQMKFKYFTARDRYFFHILIYNPVISCGQLIIYWWRKVEYPQKTTVRHPESHRQNPPYTELAKTFFSCLTLGQTGTGVLSDPWPLCLSHHFFVILYMTCQILFFLYRTECKITYSHDH